MQLRLITTSSAALARTPLRNTSSSSFSSTSFSLPTRCASCTLSIVRQFSSKSAIFASSSTAAPSSSSASSSSSSPSSAFGSRPRLSSAAFSGPLTPATPTPSRLQLTEAMRIKQLSPQRVIRGNNARAAQRAKELHEPNKNRLNHSLSYHISHTKTWADCVTLGYEHMHHLTLHNWIRILQKLVKLSPTRQVLDYDSYNKFGRFMVQTETRMHEFDRAALMQHVFVPYHYLRQCLKQMYMAQTRIREENAKDPEGTKYARFEMRLKEQADQERNEERKLIERKVEEEQKSREEKYEYGRRDAKTLKVRSRERRAGRVFVSIAETHRAENRRRPGQKSRPSSKQRRPQVGSWRE